MKRTPKLVILLLATLAVGIVIGRTLAKPRLVLYSAELADAGAKTIIPYAEFDRMPLAQCIDRLSEMTGAGIVVRWDRLAELGTGKNTPVTVTIRNLPLDKAVEALLLATGDEVPTARFDDRFIWYLDNGTIVITAGADREKFPTVCRMYDARNIISHAMSSRRGIVEKAVGKRRMDNKPEGSTTTIANYVDPDFDEDEGPTFEELEDDIILMLTETVDPDTWRDAGGTLGSIRSISGLLIIEQTRQAHEKIAVTLRQLEEAMQQ